MPADARGSTDRSPEPHAGRRRALAAALASCLTFAAAARAQESTPADDSGAGVDYVATPGFRLGKTGLTIGGFSTVELDAPRDEPAELALDSVNPLILFEPSGFVRAFAELEIGGLFLWKDGDVESDLDVTIERLYGEVSGADALNVRLGKFQTPVGLWNVVPAEPFTWTATTPVLVDEAFEEHQTGGALFGTFYPGAQNLEYWVYGQFLDPLDPDETPVDRSVGARLRWGGARSDWGLGASYLHAWRDGESNDLFGIDVFWSRGPLELQAEALRVKGEIPARDFKGAYVQAAYHLGAHLRPLNGLHLVGRFERFEPSDGEPASNVGNLGLACLPRSWLNLKAGYQFVQEPSDHARPGLFASVSVVF